MKTIKQLRESRLAGAMIGAGLGAAGAGLASVHPGLAAGVLAATPALTSAGMKLGDKLANYIKKRKKKLEEDAPANSAGGGNVAGLGVGPKGEPGVLVGRQKKKIKDGVQDSQERQSAVMAFTRRAAPTITTGINETSDELKKRYVARASGDASMAAFTKRVATGKAKKDAEEIHRKRTKGLNLALKEEATGINETSDELKKRYVARASGDASMAAFTKRVATGKAKKDAEEIHRKRTKGLNLALKEEETPGSVAIGSFAGNQTFVLPSKKFNEMRMHKAKGKHWRKYIGEDEHGQVIREYARKNPKRPIILQDENTGAMCYARYGGKYD